MMKRFTPEELAEVLRLHALWLADADGGIRANLCDANLCGADLRGANGINIIQVGPIGSRRATTTYWIDEDRVVCGCWNDYLGGTLDEFQARVHQEHANSPRYLAEYTEAIAQFRVAREYAEPKPSKQEEV